MSTPRITDIFTKPLSEPPAAIDPDILRYREERERRAVEPDTRLVEAKVLFAETMRRKGGRPKKGSRS